MRLSLFEDPAHLAFANAEFGGEHAVADGTIAVDGIAVASPALDQRSVA